MKKMGLLALVASLVGSMAFARDVVLQEGQSMVVCADDTLSDEAHPVSAIMKINRMLLSKTLQAPGEVNGAVIYVINAPFTASAPTLTPIVAPNVTNKFRMCVTLTQQ